MCLEDDMTTTKVWVLAALAVLIVVIISAQAVQISRTKAQLVAVQGERDTARLANEINASTIAVQKDVIRRNDASMTELQSKYKTLSDKKQSIKNTIKSLGDTDETVDTYLKRPVPDSLRGVLDKAYSPS